MRYRDLTGLTVSDLKKSSIVYQQVAQMMINHKLQWLMQLGEIWFAPGTDDNEHARYIPQQDLIILDASWYPEDGLQKSLVHELGHRLHQRLSLLKGFKVWWQHRRQDKTAWHGNPDWLYNHHETFAEMFRYYIYGALPKDMEEWLKKLIAKAR